MGKLINDKIAAETLETIVLNPTTINNYKENTILEKQELEVATSVIFDNGIIEKIPGTTLANTETPTNAVMGLHRAYGKGTEKVCLRLTDGDLKSGPAAFATTVLTGLSSSKRTPFVNVKGKTWGINETNGIIRYDPKTVTGQLTNIISPHLMKKIAFMESDETWVGEQASNGVYRPEEFSGNAVTSRHLSAAASGTGQSYSNLTLDLSQFANTKASDDNDTISFLAFHDIWNNITSLSIEFSTGDTTYAVKFMATIYQSSFEQLDFEWTPFDVKKGAFVATGAADWATVKSVRLTATANANGALNMYVDFMHLKVAKPEAIPLNKSIITCESNTGETWTGDATLQSVAVKEGFRSMRVKGEGGAQTATCTLGTAINLALWVDSSTSPVTDDLVFDIYTNAVAQITDASCLTLNI